MDYPNECIIYVRLPQQVTQDIAALRLGNSGHNETSVWLLPDNGLAMSYDSEAESKISAIHEAADIVRALFATSEGFAVSAVMTEVAAVNVLPFWRQMEMQQRPIEAQLFMLLASKSELYACLASGSELNDDEQAGFALSVRRISANFLR